MMRALAFVGLFLLAAVLAVQATSRSPTATPNPIVPTPTATPVVSNLADPPVRVEGSGVQKSRPFVLSGGAYTIIWTARPGTTRTCGHSGSLKRVDGGLLSGVGEPPIPNVTPRELFASVVVEQPVGAETQVYGLKPGEYYFDFESSCDWTASLAPQR